MFWNGRTEKHQTSTARFRLAEENGQRCPFPVPCALFPHPLQNRVPRGERAPVALSREPTELAGETKSFCPCHKTGENTGFSHPVLPVLNCSHPLQHPKRTRFRLFRAESGAFSHFLLFFRRKIFRIFFVHSADIAHRLKSFNERKFTFYKMAIIWLTNCLFIFASNHSLTPFQLRLVHILITLYGNQLLFLSCENGFISIDNKLTIHYWCRLAGRYHIRYLH